MLILVMMIQSTHHTVQKEQDMPTGLFQVRAISIDKFLERIG
jgi:hypothetical protein